MGNIESGANKEGDLRWGLPHDTFDSPMNPVLQGVQYVLCDPKLLLKDLIPGSTNESNHFEKAQ